MDFLLTVADIFLHLDSHLATLIEQMGSGVYVVLFLIIVGETGLVIAPLLPGDSLLFASGALAGGGLLSLPVLLPLLIVAAIAGDSLNYSIGHWVGPKVFQGKSRLLNREHLRRTHEFFEKHGGKTIVLARFLPIIRTCAPFVAGVGSMDYKRFFMFNVVGGMLWVTLFTVGGFLFGQLPAVKENFSLVILGIVGVSLIPIAIEWIRGLTRPKAASARD